MDLKMASETFVIRFTDYGGHGFEHDGLFLPSLNVNSSKKVNNNLHIQQFNSKHFFTVAEENPDIKYTLLLGITELPFYQDWEKLEYTIDKLVPLKNVNIELRNTFDLQENVAWDRENKLKYACRNIEPERLTFAVNNMLTVKKLKSFFKNSTVVFESDFLPRFHETTEPYVPYTGLREKHFICLNSRISYHRDEVYNYLKDKNNSILSYRLRGVFLEDEDNPWNINQKQLFEEHPEYLSDDSGHMAEDPDGNWQTYQDVLSPTYYNNTCVYVCTETLSGSFLHDNNQGTFKREDIVTHWFTEKVFKSFYYRLPMIVVGMPYVLESLRMLGFRTWGDFWDESYDWKNNEEQRLSIIKVQLDQLSNKSIEQLNEMYYSEKMQRILNHNQRLFNDLYDKYMST